MGNAKKPILVTLSIIAIAIIMMGFNGFSGNGMLNLGIDFASGTKIAVTSTDNSITIDDVTAEFEELGYMEATFQKSGNNVVNVTIKDSLSRDEISIIKANFKAIYGVEPNDNVVTPLVGKDLVKDAFFLSILAWIAMLGYITVRFKWDFGVSAIVALIHDVVFVLAIFAIFRIEVNIELVSVILAIIGYSINNSIVVFDRIREVLSERNEDKMSHADYKEVVNIALDNTIIRSIFSSFTTILPVIALLMLGSEAIFVFNIAMFSGLIAGTLSSIYISPKVWLFIREHHTSKPKTLKVYKEKIDELPVKGINA
jgi:SecD/SecF fusion protein